MLRRTFLKTAIATPFVIATPSLAQSAHRIRELYAGRDMSAFATENKGTRLTFTGYMAPPLKAESNFFVLTNIPMSVCPFCETEAEWPNNILAVYTKRVVNVIPFSVRITVRGNLDIGGYKDPESGFVSVIRLMDATYAEA